MKVRTILGLLLLAGSAAVAQTDNPNAVTITPGVQIATAVAGMAKTASATVVVDPAVSGTVSAAIAKLPLEEGLTAIARAQKAQWRKAYLKPAEVPHDSTGKIDTAKVKNMVEAASLAPTTTIGVIDQATGQIAITTRTPATSAATQEWLKGRNAIYVLFRPSVGGALGNSTDPVADYMSATKNSMETFKNMTPEQRQQAMQQGLDMVLNMDPQTMGDMMHQQMQAMMNLPPETKAKLMDLSMKMMGNGPGGGAPGGAPGQ